jgi:hypothetical protein
VSGARMTPAVPGRATAATVECDPRDACDAATLSPALERGVATERRGVPAPCPRGVPPPALGLDTAAGAADEKSRRGAGDSGAEVGRRAVVPPTRRVAAPHHQSDTGSGGRGQRAQVHHREQTVR